MIDSLQMPSLANKTKPYYNPLLSQQGWIVLPAIIITARMRGAIHTSTTNKIHKFLEIFSQVAIKYLTRIISNKQNLRRNKHQSR